MNEIKYCSTCKHYIYKSDQQHADRCKLFPLADGSPGSCYQLRVIGGRCEDGKAWEAA